MARQVGLDAVLRPTVDERAAETEAGRLGDIMQDSAVVRPTAEGLDDLRTTISDAMPDLGSAGRAGRVAGAARSTVSRGAKAGARAGLRGTPIPTRTATKAIDRVGGLLGGDEDGGGGRSRSGGGSSDGGSGGAAEDTARETSQAVRDAMQDAASDIGASIATEMTAELGADVLTSTTGARSEAPDSRPTHDEAGEPNAASRTGRLGVQLKQVDLLEDIRDEIRKGNLGDASRGGGLGGAAAGVAGGLSVVLAKALGGAGSGASLSGMLGGGSGGGSGLRGLLGGGGASGVASLFSGLPAIMGARAAERSQSRPEDEQGWLAEQFGDALEGIEVGGGSSPTGAAFIRPNQEALNAATALGDKIRENGLSSVLGVDNLPTLSDALDAGSVGSLGGLLETDSVDSLGGLLETDSVEGLSSMLGTDSIDTIGSMLGIDDVPSAESLMSMDSVDTIGSVLGIDDVPTISDALSLGDLPTLGELLAGESGADDGGGGGGGGGGGDGGISGIPPTRNPGRDRSIDTGGVGRPGRGSGRPSDTGGLVENGGDMASAGGSGGAGQDPMSALSSAITEALGGGGQNQAGEQTNEVNVTNELTIDPSAVANEVSDEVQRAVDDAVQELQDQISDGFV